MVTSQQQPAGLRVSVLGDFSLQLDNRPIPSIPRKGRALLAYLAVEESPTVQRDALADLLWSDRGADQARHSLRQLLLVLRRELPGLLTGSDNSVALDSTRISCDFQEWRALAAASDRADLARAATLFAGPLLTAFPPISRDFDDWLARKSDETTRTALESMGRLVDTSWADGDHVAAILAAERMVAIDALREDSHRRLMMAYARGGRRIDALRQYTACSDVFRRELDVDPSAETKALVERLRRGETGAAPVSLPLVATAPSPLPQRSRPVAGMLAPDDAPVIAVLPFRPAGTDRLPDYLADGIVEDIVYLLAGLREPVVISAGSTRRFRDTPADDPTQFAEQLGADYVVTGSLHVNGDSVRLAAEMAETSRDAIVWGRSMQISKASLFDAQAGIAASIANALVPRLNEVELRASRRQAPEHLGAYHLLLQARDRMFKFTPEEFEEARPLLERAAALEPDYAPIYATMVEWRCYRIFQGWSPDREADARALEAAANRALRLDPFHSRALALYGHNRTIIGHHYDEALDLLDRAVAAGPNDAETLIWASPTLAYVGRAEEAITRASRAIALSPQDPFLFRYEHFLSIAHYAAGNLEQAAQIGLRSASRHPNFTSNLRFTIAALAGLGRIAQTAPLVERLMTLQPTLRVSASLPRYAFRDAAQRERHARYLRLAGVPG